MDETIILEEQTPAVGDEQIKELMQTLERYRSGKRELDSRIRSSEEWWRLRNTNEEQKDGHQRHAGFKSKSGWLHNVIQSKHADAMDAFPEPNILPREMGDRKEAEMLSKIIPCVLEQNDFERTYSKAWWSKLKFGTGVYKVVWDASLLNGLGDISVLRSDPLALYWEPTIEDIQDSRYLFEVAYYTEDVVRELFPQLGDDPLPHNAVSDLYREQMKDAAMRDKVPVISAYYKRGRAVHLCQFIPGKLLYATENDEMYADTGLYAHGKYPFVFDALFPVEKSPCGYGYIDLCKQPQMEIDLLKSAMVDNAKAGAKPRYFYSQTSGINREQFLDLDDPLVEVSTVSDTSIQPVTHIPLDGNYLALLQETVQELRETSGNTDAATGTTPSGVTAASAIAALQEASGKTSRDASMSGYAAYSEVVELCIELIRQFYDAPRTFRILGSMGEESFVEYDNSGIQPEPLMNIDGTQDGMRVPMFDIKIVPQRRSAYTKMANNDLALQFYGVGFFDPQRSDQAIACLSMMDFDGREELIKRIRQNGTMFEQIQQLAQYAMMLAAKYQDQMALQQIQMIMQRVGGGQTAPTGDGVPTVPQVDAEPAHMVKARQGARGSALPTEGGGAE